MTMSKLKMVMGPWVKTNNNQMLDKIKEEDDQEISARLYLLMHTKAI